MKISLRETEQEDYLFTYSVKKQALGSHIKAKWEWNEAYQQETHLKKWTEKPWLIIVVDGLDVGTVSIEYIENHIRFGEFYLLDQFRNRGIGTKVLMTLLDTADETSQEVFLEYLKWNPVGSLYKRCGFEIIDENDIHYFMKRIPQTRDDWHSESL